MNLSVNIHSLFVCFKGRSGYRGLPRFPLCLTNQIHICNSPKRRELPPHRRVVLFRSLDRNHNLIPTGLHFHKIFKEKIFLFFWYMTKSLQLFSSIFFRSKITQILISKKVEYNYRNDFTWLCSILHVNWEAGKTPCEAEIWSQMPTAHTPRLVNTSWCIIDVIAPGTSEPGGVGDRARWTIIPPSGIRFCSSNAHFLGSTLFSFKYCSSFHLRMIRTYFHSSIAHLELFVQNGEFSWTVKKIFGRNRIKTFSFKSRYLLRFFDCLARHNLSATFATDEKWPLFHLRISYQNLAGSLSSLQISEFLNLIIWIFQVKTLNN